MLWACISYYCFVTHKLFKTLLAFTNLNQKIVDKVMVLQNYGVKRQDENKRSYCQKIKILYQVINLAI